MIFYLEIPRKVDRRPMSEGTLDPGIYSYSVNTRKGKAKTTDGLSATFAHSHFSRLTGAARWHLMHASRAWKEDPRTGKVEWFKNRELWPGEPVDMKEFFWIKLQAKQFN